jgi:hypothetical protein
MLASIQQTNSLVDNNRTYSAYKELELWINVYKEKHVASQFFINLLFVFQDYQYLYMIYEYVEGFTMDSVLKYHAFTE